MIILIIIDIIIIVIVIFLYGIAIAIVKIVTLKNLKQDWIKQHEIRWDKIG